MTFNYTNAQFRSILNGFGFRSQGLNEPNFPVSNDNTPMTDAKTVQAIKDFQQYFNLKRDGIVGPNTRAKAQQAVYILQYGLDLVVKPNPRLRPQDTPLYGPQTAQAVGTFRREYGFEPDGDRQTDRVADLSVRRKLQELTSGLTESANL